MNALVLYSTNDLRLEKVMIPKIKSDEVLIRVQAVGVCGSDIGRIVRTGTCFFPSILGHEFSGMIAEIGEDNNMFEIGDRVTAVPLIPCRKCHYCQSGYFSLCEKYNFIGSRISGAFTEYVKVPLQNVLKITNEVSFDHAAMIEPSSVVLHGILKTGITIGDNVVVLGLGPVGQFAIQWSKILGANKIYGVDIVPEKLKVAQKIGCDEVILATEQNPVKYLSTLNGIGPDIVIETAGSHITQIQSIQIVRKKGTVLLLGTAHHDVVFKPQTWESILRKELKIEGTWNSYSSPFPGKEWFSSIEFIKNERLILEPMISHRIGLEEAPNLIENIYNNSNFYFNKIIINP